MFIILSISLLQLAKPSLLSRFEIAKTIAVKTMSINCSKIPIKLGKTKNKIKKNRTDINKTLYLNIAKIENE